MHHVLWHFQKGINVLFVYFVRQHQLSWNITKNWLNPECSQLLLRITYHLFIVFWIYKTLVIDKLMQVCYVLCVHLLFSLLKLHSGFFGDRHSLNINCCLKTLYFFYAGIFQTIKASLQLVTISFKRAG